MLQKLININNNTSKTIIDETSLGKVYQLKEQINNLQFELENKVDVDCLRNNLIDCFALLIDITTLNNMNINDIINEYNKKVWNLNAQI